MGIQVAPNLIEQSSFTGGWQPDLERAAVPPDGLLDVLNLLPDVGTGSLEVRKGFKRVSAALPAGYQIQSIFPYNRLVPQSEVDRLSVDATGGTFTITVGANTTSAQNYNVSAATLKSQLEGLASVGTGNVDVTGGPGNSGATTPYTITFKGTLANQSVVATANGASLTGSAHKAVLVRRNPGQRTGQYLILVLGTNIDNVSDNLRVYSYDLRTNTATQVSPSLQVWASGNGRHWGLTINQTFYGGGPKDPMYSWNPDDGWNGTPSIQNFPTIILGNNPTGNQRSFNYAFRRGAKVLYTDPLTYTAQAYSADRNNRFQGWKSGEDYKKSELVSLAADWGGGVSYMKTFECTRSHTAAVGNKPGSGAGYWKSHNLALPRDDNSEISVDWNLIPEAAVTDVAEWHAERLFMRYDNVAVTGHTRILYSAPSKPVENSDIGEVQWDPTNFQVTPSQSKDGEGEGGGWLDIRTGDGDPVTAIRSFGYYLLIWKRRSSKVLAGTNERTWVLRDLDTGVGCIGPRAHCEHEGVVYFISDEGFFFTDGTQAKEVPGGEKMHDWLRSSVNWEAQDVPFDVTMWSFGGLVWISLPTGSSRVPDRTVVYDPKTQSLWPLDLQVLAQGQNRIDGVNQSFFSLPTDIGSTFAATYAWTATRNRSRSTRTLSATTISNYIPNPNFELRTTDNPLLVDLGPDSLWYPTSTTWRTRTGEFGPHIPPPQKRNMDFHIDVVARHKGQVGAVVNNLMAVKDGVFQGIFANIADADATTHNISAYVRMSHWDDQRLTVDYSKVRLYVGNDSNGEPVPIIEGNHTFTFVGSGWWRVSATYTGAVAARPHGVIIAPQKIVHVDQVQVTKGSSLLPYFDGDGGDPSYGHGIDGGQSAFVMQYDHPAVRQSPSDDLGVGTYEARAIPWAMRTAWFPFGTVREERRIRRVWALVRTSQNILFRMFRNYNDDRVLEKDATPDSDDPVTYFDGTWIPDSYAISLQISGVGAPATTLGVAVQTEPRRLR